MLRTNKGRTIRYRKNEQRQVKNFHIRLVVIFVKIKT